MTKDTLYLYKTHLQKYGPSTCKSADADTDWCSYVPYERSFCNYAVADTDADWSILAIRLSTVETKCAHTCRSLNLNCAV